MKKEKTVQRPEKLEKFQLSKKEGLQLEGGPETERGTVTGPVDTDD